MNDNLTSKQGENDDSEGRGVGEEDDVTQFTELEMFKKLFFDTYRSVALTEVQHHTIPKSSNQVAPTEGQLSTVSHDAFILELVDKGYLDCSDPPSTREESHNILAFTSACTEVLSYLRYLPCLLPWNDMSHTVDQMFLSERDFPSDFCWSPYAGSRFLAAVMREGFIPIADCIVGNSASRYSFKRERLPSQEQTSLEPENTKYSPDLLPSNLELERRNPRVIILLPKLNRTRCILKPQDVHVGKNARKRSSRFSMTVNQDFDKVVEGCVTQHGESWLYPPVSAALKSSLGPREICPSVYSVEVYFENRLVAGELGVVNGTCYTSYTGFSSMDSAGSVQLVTLGRFLYQRGIETWDLGMHMAYKEDLGSRCFSRKDFIRLFRSAREKPSIDLTMQEKTNCRTILDNKPDKNGK